MGNTGQGRYKILIVKLGAIGDVAMALPMVEAVRKLHADVELTWLCGKTVEPILKLVDGIDNIITVDEAKLFKGNPFEKIGEISRCLKYFTFKYFDIIITPYRDKRYKILTLTAGKKEFRNFFGAERLNSIIPGRHHTIEYIKLVTGIDDSAMNEYAFPKVTIPSYPEIEKIFQNNSDKFIALAPGGAKNLLNEDQLRNWSLDSYVELANKLTGKNLKIILLGAKSDEWIVESFKNVEVINLVDKTSIPQLLSVLKNVNLLISHDTGILHLGKLTDTLSIGLFGPVNPSERIGINENIKTIWHGNSLNCSPCYNGKIFAQCKNNICMKTITVDSVFELAENLINNIE